MSQVRRQQRNRTKLKKVTKRQFRVSVYRSNKNIYCQLIDDIAQKTIAASSTKEESLKIEKFNIDAAKKVGLALGEKAIKLLDTKEIYFDRGSYIYHGKVKALAEGIREAGLKF